MQRALREVQKSVSRELDVRKVISDALGDNFGEVTLVNGGSNFLGKEGLDFEGGKGGGVSRRRGRGRGAVKSDGCAEKPGDAGIVVLAAGSVEEIEAEGRRVKERRPEDLVGKRGERSVVEVVGT